MLAHSQKFFSAVQGDARPIAEVYADFMAAYSTLGFAPIPTPSDPRMAAVVNGIENLLIAASVDNSWLNFISAMLDAWEPGLANMPAVTPSNPRLFGRELANAMSLAPSAYLGAKGGTLSYGALGGGALVRRSRRFKLQASIPTYRWVRANGSLAVVAPLTDGASAVRFNQQPLGPVTDVAPLGESLGSVPVSRRR